MYNGTHSTLDTSTVLPLSEYKLVKAVLNLVKWESATS